jgi:isocitrate dehydrogenase
MTTYERLKPPANGERITVGAGGALRVPDRPVLLFIEGDGTGPELWSAAVRVFDAAVERANGGRRRIEWFEVYAGEKSNQVYGPGTWLPEETLTAFREYRIGIKGPLSTPVGGGIRSINVALRQLLAFNRCEIYVDPMPAGFKGLRFDEAHARGTDAVLIGLQRPGQDA